MKAIKAKVLGIDKIAIKDKETSKISEMFHYYISIGECNIMGERVESTYSANLIKDEYLLVVPVTIDNKKKYKVVEFN